MWKKSPKMSYFDLILPLIPLRAIIRVKFHSQFIPNSTGQQCNLEKAEQFEPNPPRAVWDSVFSKSTSSVYPKLP